MTEHVVCPGCGTDEHLSGQSHEGLIRVTCEACGLAWDRDPTAHCRACGSRDVRPVPQAVSEKVRGNQFSTVGMRVVHLCLHCDAELVSQQLRTNSPLAPDQRPLAQGP